MKKKTLFEEENSKLPAYLHGADNVYRTKYYIVKQVIKANYSYENFAILVSIDTFYLRTKERDNEYEYFLDFIKNIDGKRIKTAMSTRTYID